MKVHRLVIHQLEKDAKVRGIKLYNSAKKLMPINDGINRMYSLIHESFEKDKTRHCKFKTESTNNAVTLNINEYLRKSDDEVFLTYSQASLGELASAISKESFATGGYYLFADYTVTDRRYLSIIIGRKKEGFNFEWSPDKENFEFNDINNLNTDKLAMGFRINIGLFETKDTIDRNYIALVTNQGDSLSGYFLGWVNASDAVNGKIQTAVLVGAVKNLIPKEFIGEEADFLSRAFDHIDDYRKSNKGKVNIDDISQSLFGDKSIIRDYVENTLNKEIDPDIFADTSELKKLIQIKASVKGINLTIDSSKFATDEVSIVNGALIIRNSTIVNQIRSQQESHE